MRLSLLIPPKCAVKLESYFRSSPLILHRRVSLLCALLFPLYSGLFQAVQYCHNRPMLCRWPVVPVGMGSGQRCSFHAGEMRSEVEACPQCPPVGLDLAGRGIEMTYQQE